MTNYQKGKAKAIQYAINYQINSSYSWGEIFQEQNKLNRFAKRYGLIKEFKDNGII